MSCSDDVFYRLIQKLASPRFPQIKPSKIFLWLLDYCRKYALWPTTVYDVIEKSVKIYWACINHRAYLRHLIKTPIKKNTDFRMMKMQVLKCKLVSGFWSIKIHNPCSNLYNTPHYGSQMSANAFSPWLEKGNIGSKNDMLLTDSTSLCTWKLSCLKSWRAVIQKLWRYKLYFTYLAINTPITQVSCVDYYYFFYFFYITVNIYWGNKCT